MHKTSEQSYLYNNAGHGTLLSWNLENSLFCLSISARHMCVVQALRVCEASPRPTAIDLWPTGLYNEPHVIFFCGESVSTANVSFVPELQTECDRQNDRNAAIQPKMTVLPHWRIAHFGLAFAVNAELSACIFAWLFIQQFCFFPFPFIKNSWQKRNRILSSRVTDTKSYWSVIETYVCEHLAQCYYLKAAWPGVKLAITKSQVQRHQHYTSGSPSLH